MKIRNLLYMGGGMVIGIFYAFVYQGEDAKNFRIFLMTATSILAFLLVYFERGSPMMIALLIATGISLVILLHVLTGETSGEGISDWGTLLTGFLLSLVTSLIGAGAAWFVKRTGSSKEHEQ